MSSKTKTTATKEEAKPALVPKLRFPEFREADGWAQMRLIDTADRSVKWSFIGGPFGSNLKSSDYVPDGVRIIQLQNIGDGEFFNEYQIFTTPQKADELLSNNIYPGEIIMSKMGDPVGRACLIPEDHDRYVMCSDGIRLVVDEKENDKYFIYSLINSPLFRAVVEKTATGSTRKRIGLDDLKSLPMWLPKKSEQQKIAECLSSVDELMAAQARKVDALKTHKKGLMQQLFPREGETQPRLRFPEFQNAGEWEAKTLVDACRMQAGKFVAAADIKEQNGDDLFSCYGGNGLRGFTATHTHDGVYPLIGRQGALCGNVKFASGRFHATEHAVVATPNQGVEVVWLYYLLDLLNLNRFATGQAQPGLSVDVLEKVPVTIPKDESEQQRIASCLSSLDALITLESQKLDALKTHKKGLMQQLFPSTGEVEA